MTTPRPLLLLVINVVRPNRADTFLPAAAQSWAGRGKTWRVRGGMCAGGASPSPLPRAVRLSGRRTGPRRRRRRSPRRSCSPAGVWPLQCTTSCGGGVGGPIVHVYKQFEKIGKKPAHIGKRVHVRVLYPSCAFIRYFNHGARRQKSRSRTFSIGNRYERVY